MVPYDGTASAFSCASFIRIALTFVLFVAVAITANPPALHEEPEEAINYYSVATNQKIPHKFPAGPAVTRGYDPPEKRWQSGHRGVDLQAVAGQEITASADGEVYFAGVIAGRPSTSIMHADGIRTTYQPVRALVAKGDPIRQGEVIGILEEPAEFNETGLHWGALRGKDYLNPLDLIERREIVLKPV